MQRGCKPNIAMFSFKCIGRLAGGATWYVTSQYIITLESGSLAFLFMQVFLHYIGSRVGFVSQAVLFFMFISFQFE